VCPGAYILSSACVEPWVAGPSRSGATLFFLDLRLDELWKMEFLV
jgi:hypothetical protein